jgi:hypothetical protein
VKRDIERHVATMFAVDMANHRMIVRLDQGLHRHLVFEQPEHSWNDRFELITAPGSLTITGDRGSHTFRRMTDMFAFFRTSGDDRYRINPQYWAEKLPDGGRSVQVYDEDKTSERLKELLKDLAEEYRRDLADWRAEVAEYGDDAGDKPEMPKVLRTARELVSDYRYEIGYEAGARQLLGELESIGAASDTWEWDLSDWDFHFLHNLHAIAWGIRQYDNAVKSGLHKVRPALVAWDTPIPCTPPKKPAKAKPKPIAINAIVMLAPAPRPVVKTAAVVGGVL